MTATTPGEDFANGAMTYIAIGQGLGLVAFLIASVWIWVLFYKRIGGIGGFAAGMLAGLVFGVLCGAVTAFAWPLTILALIVFGITRAQGPRPVRAPPGFQP